MAMCVIVSFLNPANITSTNKAQGTALNQDYGTNSSTTEIQAILREKYTHFRKIENNVTMNVMVEDNDKHCRNITEDHIYFKGNDYEIVLGFTGQ